MKRSILEKAKEKSDSRLAFIVNYPQTTSSGDRPPLRFSVMFDVPRTSGFRRYLAPSRRFIGDLRMKVAEKDSPTGAMTTFDHRETALIGADGTQTADNLKIKDVLKSLLKRTVEYLVNFFGGPLTIIVGALWDLVDKKNQPDSTDGSFQIDFFKWWTLIKWHTRPGSVLVDLRVSLLPDIDVTGKIQGKSKYVVEVGATLGKPRSVFRLGPLGAKIIDQIELSGNYETVWEA